MLNAYLGIVSPSGLDVMVPEHEHSLVFLLRRLGRRTNHRECGVWFVLPQEVAEEVPAAVEAAVADAPEAMEAAVEDPFADLFDETETAAEEAGEIASEEIPAAVEEVTEEVPAPVEAAVADEPEAARNAHRARGQGMHAHRLRQLRPR